MKNYSVIHAYEVRPRKDHRGVDLISDVLPFGRLWYDEPKAVANASDSHSAAVFLSSRGRGFVSRLLCILLDHVFALPRRAVKTRAFPVVNTCLSVNPHLAMASARRRWIGRYLGCAPCRHRAWHRTRFPRSLRFLGSGSCSGRSRWRPRG